MKKAILNSRGSGKTMEAIKLLGNEITLKDKYIKDLEEDNRRLSKLIEMYRIKVYGSLDKEVEKE